MSPTRQPPPVPPRPGDEPDCRAARMALKLATYNVHGCVGRDGRDDPERVLQVLGELQADVIALQELHWSPDAALDRLRDFAHGLGCTPLAGPTLQRGSGHYGNALLTRLPVLDVARHDLSVPGREPRGALDVRLQAADGPLRVLATHLGLRPAERRWQVQRLLAAADAVAGPDVAPVQVLLGDLNEWFLWGRPLRSLHRHFGAAPAPPTFPSGWPLFALDRVWVHPRARLLRVSRHRSALARVASDHLPLCAELGDGPGAGAPSPNSGGAIGSTP